MNELHVRSLCGPGAGIAAALLAAAGLVGGCSEAGSGGNQPTASAQPPPPPPPPTATLPAGWQGSLQRSAVALFTTQSICTGTWISAHAVLTAAHCVEELDPTTLSVVPLP